MAELTLDDILRQLAVTDDQTRAAKMNALAQFGFGLMGAKKGREGEAVGRAGSYATDQYRQGLLGARQENADKFKLSQWVEQQNKAQRKAQEDAAFQQQVAGAFAPQSPTAAMGPGGPTPQNAERVQAAAQTNPQIAQYRQAAQLYAARGNVEAASKFAAIADKMEEEYSTSPQNVRGPDGKLQLAQFGKRGNTKVAQGMTPAEKLHFANTGGQAGVGFDPYSGEQRSQGAAVTMDPAQADASRRGWAQYRLSAGADARAAAAEARGPAGTYDPERGVIVDTRAGTARPVTTGGQPLGAKPTMSAKKALEDIDSQVAVVDGALKAVKETPTAFGFKRGTATLMGTTAESLAGRLDSTSERTTRSYVFNIVSKVINERAGAAQSKQELARLRSFLPSEQDSAEQVTDKLNGFQDYLRDLRGSYAPGASATGSFDIDPSAIEAEMKRRGLK